LVISAEADDVATAAGKNVFIHRIVSAPGRSSRMILKSLLCFLMALKTNSKIYHFHDPEMIPFGFLFVIFGKIVIYDVHEDTPRDILSKKWIPSCTRKRVSAAIECLEHFGARFFFSIVCATPFISKRFSKVTSRVVNINNYPLEDNLKAARINITQGNSTVCYVGNICADRGITEMVKAMENVKTAVKLVLVGQFTDPNDREKVQSEVGWRSIDFRSWQDRSGVLQVLSSAMAGLVVLHPVVNYIDALPVKMFEYMAAGLPVIASRFPLWVEIIEGNKCGICVNPLDPYEIAAAIDFIATHPKEAAEMGANGRRAVVERYNWRCEEEKQLSLYSYLDAK
jgi:glycosyltransferase involved in cell wall biosynthesis